LKGCTYTATGTCSRVRHRDDSFAPPDPHPQHGIEGLCKCSDCSAAASIASQHATAKTATCCALSSSHSNSCCSQMSTSIHHMPQSQYLPHIKSCSHKLLYITCCSHKLPYITCCSHNLPYITCCSQFQKAQAARKRHLHDNPADMLPIYSIIKDSHRSQLATCRCEYIMLLPTTNLQPRFF
jgi:hypothetical protein